MIFPLFAVPNQAIAYGNTGTKTGTAAHIHQ